ncbi:MAG TPA: enoyl-CoA hydratase-related protein [Pseudonocardiaceae bacterium]
MAPELVHRSITRGIATITLDSPRNRNALSAQLRRELTDHLDAALADDAVRVIVLDHTGPVFCAGMDLREARGTGTEDQGVNEFPAILERIWTSPKPVVAKVAGPARAGGVGLMAACDIVVAVETAEFAFSEVRLGLVPAVISATVLPRLAPHAAHELFLTGEKFGARRAAEIGLVNAAVPAEDLDATVRRYTQALLLGGPTALATTKKLLRGSSFEGLAGQVAELQALSARFFGAAEGQEGITAFAQKRPPSWVPAE